MCELVESLRARESILFPIAEIRRERMPWHTRVVVSDEEVERLARAIKLTREMVPIRVVKADDGYDFVTGLLRLLVAVAKQSWDSLGSRAIRSDDMVPAHQCRCEP